MSNLVIAGREVDKEEILDKMKVYNDVTRSHAPNWDPRKCLDLKGYMQKNRHDTHTVPKLLQDLEKGQFLKVLRKVHPFMKWCQQFYVLEMNFFETFLSDHFEEEERDTEVSQSTVNLFDALQTLMKGNYDPEEDILTRFNPFFPERGGVDEIAYVFHTGDHSPYERRPLHKRMHSVNKSLWRKDITTIH